MTDNKLQKFRQSVTKWFTTPRILVVGFLSFILVGALLLMLPFSSKTEGSISFLTALFTATSATCVTGLTVVNVSETYTFFGQFVIMLLIQLGGIGFMTVASAIYIMVGKTTLRTRLQMKEDLQQKGLSNLKGLTLRVIVIALISEGIGAVLLTIGFSKYYNFGDALWRGVFHSVSAYCNAGFDLITLGEGSMTAFADNPLILLTISALIIVGGLGFLVFTDIAANKKWSRLSLHTKVVLIVTSVLLTFGTVSFMFAEYNNPDTIGNMSFGNKLLNSFFQSTTTRTAGFNSFSMAKMTSLSYLLSMMLMFVGASPSSTGGGIKTTTLFVLLSATYTVICRKKDTIVDKHEINKLTVYKACTTLFLAIVVMVVSLSIMIIAEGADANIIDLLFEQISAYATVGLSTGITAGLSVASKLVLILNMFVGRVGVLSFFLTFAKTNSVESKIKYLDANIRL